MNQKTIQYCIPPETWVSCLAVAISQHPSQGCWLMLYLVSFRHKVLSEPVWFLSAM